MSQSPTFAPVEIERGRGLVTVDGRTFPLESARLVGRARGGLALSRLVQSYANPYEEPLEVVYSMPLPADGAVVAYTIRLGDRVVTGEIEPAERAKERYEQALIEGHAAGLLEQERADTFTQHLGNLPPGAPVTVEIDVLHPVGFSSGGGEDAGRWEYRFPTVTGVRYHGAPGRVPDAGRLDSDRAEGAGTPVRLSLELSIEDGSPEQIEPRADRHRLEVTPAAEGTLVTLATPARLDRDVAVRWRATGAESRAALALGPGLPEDEGRYGLLTLTPPDLPAATSRRDLTLLLDASGSMSGEPLETAKAIARTLLRSLAPEDRFTIVAFGSFEQPLTDGHRPATEEEIAAALRSLDSLRAEGGTEMVAALKSAMRRLRDGAQHQIVLLTDGYISFEEAAAAAVLKRLPRGCRIHVAGIGAAPNRTLSLGVVRAGRGLEVIADGARAAESAARRLLAATVGPIVEDLRVFGSAVLASAPERPRDLLAGAPALMTVELPEEGGAIEVEGRLPDGSVWRQRFDVPRSGEDVVLRTELPVGALFGRERIADLEMRLASRLGREDAGELLDEIEAAGLRHRIVSRRTSLVAISEAPVVDPTSPRRRVRLATELPSGVSAEGIGLPSFPPMPRACRGWFVAETPAPYRDEPPAGDLAEIVRYDRERLVLDFEVAADRVVVPEGDLVTEWTFGGSTERVKARVVPEGSTRPGPVESGLRVRLVLEWADDEPRAGGWDELLRELGEAAEWTLAIRSAIGSLILRGVAAG